MATAAHPRRSTRNVVKKEQHATPELKTGDVARSRGIKRESTSTPATPPSKRKRIKTEEISPSIKVSPDTIASPRKAAKASLDKAAGLQARKLKSFSAFSSKSPFPTFAHPSPQECSLAYRILAGLHGERTRPDKVVAPTNLAGCGNSPSVLDALVRTILSQNTSDKNSSRAKLAMDSAYGGSDSWDAIVQGGQPKLQRTIQSGGLSVVKSKVIISVLQETHAKYNTYSLDHLFQSSDEDAMRELLSFHGVGPKTASCVLLFCLQRPSFAVDTHVYRLTGMLGWRPASASREEAQAHLDAVVPDGDKYPLHVLFISHGKQCEECKAGGKSLGKCELRKAFRKGRVDGEIGKQEKKEEEEGDYIKKELDEI